MKKRILIVDDEPRNLALLETLLRPLGHEVSKATGGRAALARLEQDSPDLVLLDLAMPGFDGIDVLTHLRSEPRHAHLPVVLVTAHSDREHRLRALEAGADDYLEKPIDAPILLARVRTLLALKESRDLLDASNIALSRRNVDLLRLQREQRELTEFIVHDLKSPLSVAWTNLDWALGELRPPSGDLFDALVDSREATRRVRRMIDDLLTVSRLEESKFPFRAERVSITGLLQGVVQSYSRAANERSVALASVQGEEVHAQVDAPLLQRVLENILENSLRYTPSSGRVALAARQGNEVEIAISNTGPAIPFDERARIFEKFQRGNGERPLAGSAGLGLYFCKRAIEAHGGDIGVVETREFPTSFVIHLPTAVERLSKP